jgi:hypothetical protein
MASIRQIAANRRNGRLGGPRTDAGKANCKLNATDHGLCAVTTVLPGESDAAFQRLRSDLYQHWLPANNQELFEFEELARTAWRLVRLRNVETRMWSVYILDLRERNGASPQPESESDCHRAIAGVLNQMEERTLGKYFRYESAIERGYYRCLQQLQRTQSLRRREEERTVRTETADLPQGAARSAEPAAHSTAAPAHQVSQNGIRSVSQPHSIVSPTRACDPGAPEGAAILAEAS